MGQSVAVKPPVAFQKTNKINTFAHVSYGMALLSVYGWWLLVAGGIAGIVVATGVVPALGDTPA